MIFVGKYRELTFDQVDSLINYDGDTGALIWKARSEAMCKSAKEMKRWNRMYANRPAITSVASGGYLAGCILSRPIRAHQLAWMLSYGEWAAGDIDHINGCVTDNRLANLRVVADAGHMNNKRRYRNNLSGRSGVHFHKRDLKWIAYADIGRSRKWIGQFEDKESAIVAREAFDRKNGFTERHGV